MKSWYIAVKGLDNAYGATYFLNDNGDLYISGTNNNYELGDTDKSLIYRDVVLATNVKEYSEGFFHCAYITNDNKLYTVGNNEHNQCSDSSGYSSTNMLVDIDVIYVLCGPYSTTYLKNGKVYDMGSIFLGENNIRGGSKRLSPINRFITPFTVLKTFINGPYAQGCTIHDIIDNTDKTFFCGDNTSNKLPLEDQRIYYDFTQMKEFTSIKEITNFVIALNQSFILDNGNLHILGDTSKFDNIAKNNTPILIESNVSDVKISRDFSNIQIVKSKNIYERQL